MAAAGITQDGVSMDATGNSPPRVVAWRERYRVSQISLRLRNHGVNGAL